MIRFNSQLPTPNAQVPLRPDLRPDLPPVALAHLSPAPLPPVPLVPAPIVDVEWQVGCYVRSASGTVADSTAWYSSDALIGLAM